MEEFSFLKCFRRFSEVEFNLQPRLLSYIRAESALGQFSYLRN